MSPRLAVLIALVAAGCAEMPAGEDRIAYRPPAAESAARVATTKDSAGVAQALRAAGFDNVTVLRDGSVRLRSDSAALVDCGTIVQVALGNRAEFPATTAKAVLIADRPPNDPAVRSVRTRSEVRLVPLADGSGFAVGEAHRVTVTYTSALTGRSSHSSASFDGTQVARLADKSSCRSAGLVQDIVG